MKKLIPFYLSANHPPEIHFMAAILATKMSVLCGGKALQRLLPEVIKNMGKGNKFSVPALFTNLLLFLMLLLASHTGYAQNIISVEPKDGEANIKPDTDLIITFDVPIKAGKGQILVFENNNKNASDKITVKSNFVTIDGNKAIILVKKDLKPGASIHVIVPDGAFVDESGNDIPGITDPEGWNYTLEGVADEIPPDVVSYNPVAGSADVAIDASLVLTFDEQVVKGSGNITLTQGNTSQVIAVSDGAVVVNGNEVRINPPSDLPEKTLVSVQIQPGAFTDVDGNEYAGIADNTTWNFTTEDKTAPVVTDFSPADNFIGAEANANLVLTFDETIEKGTGTLILHQGLSTQSILVGSDAVSISDNIVSIDPPLDFPFLASVWVEIPAGAFIDLSGNAYGGISQASVWNFTVLDLVDTTPPVVTATTPADEATGVEVGSDLELTFSEEVEKGSGNITITQGTATQTIPVTDAAVSVNGSTVTIDPPLDFPSQTQVIVQIAAGAFTDVAGNEFAGIANNTTWKFTTEDKTVPALTSFTPANNATDVAVDVDLVLTFDEAIKAGTGSITITHGEIFQTIAVTDAAVTIADNVVRITASDFPNDVTITVSVPAGAFTDLAGNVFAGITAADWRFTTIKPADTEAPTITTYSPANGSTNIALTSDLVLTFSETVEKGTGNIILTQGNTSQVIAVTNAGITVNGATVRINPPQDFPSQTEISVQIQPGAFTDATGNEYAGITDNTTWKFTTEDKTAPTLSTFTPFNNATDVAVDADLILSFDENIKAGTGNIVINQGATSQTIAVTDALVSVNGDKVTINPADFPNNATVTVTVPEGAFTDEAGNAFSGIASTEWRFTTGAPADTEAPIIITYSPTNNITEVALASDLVLTFSEEVVKGTGNIVIKQGSTSQSIAVTDDAVVVDGTVVRIDPPVDFPSQTSVSVQIAEGAFTDIVGNKYVGISDNTTWRFTTEDKTAPILTSISPANNATDIAVDASLVFSFDEAVKVGSGSIVITHGVTSQTITVTGTLVNVSGNTVTINPSDFPNDAIVTVSFPAGAFTDLAGNVFAGITAADWRFTTIKPADTEAPVISSTTPADESENVAITAYLVVTFNEPVEKGTGNITINQGSTSQTIPVADAVVSINGNVVTINPVDFPEGTAISVQISEGAFKDMAGNNFAGITNATTWNFTTLPPADVAPPVVNTYAPADESVDVAANANLVLTFNEDVVKGTGTITITQGTTTQVIPVTSDDVNIAGNIVTVNPANIFPSGASISVQIEAGVFTDAGGNLYEGISNTSTWNFSVADTEAPALVSFTPADEATNVAFDARLEIVYNEPVVKGSGSITITQGTGSQVINVEDAAVSITGITVSINPPADLPANTLITIQMPAGTFKDFSGNAAAAIANTTGWNFTTAAPIDATAPTVSTLAPSDEASDVSINSNLVITFSEDIEKGAGNILITHGVDSQTIAVTSDAVTVSGNQVIINPANFPENTLVSIQMPAGTFTDVVGNPFAGITNNTDWNFTTEDKTAPALTSFTPANNAAGVAINTDLVIVFSENIKAETGNIVINQGTTSQTIAVSDAAVTIADNVVRINPSDFPNSATITVSVPSGAFTDLSNNAFGGIPATDWRFTTIAPVDNTAPAITAFVPANGTSNVAIDAKLMLTFSEDVKAGIGNIVINQGLTSQTISVTDAAISISGNVVTIDPPADFPSGAQVSVQMRDGAFEDLAGNSHPGITSADEWKFTVKDIIAPSLVSISPANGETNVAVKENLVLTFDEKVAAGSGDIVLTQGTTTQTIAVASPAVSIAANIVTINPADFLESIPVSVEMLAGVFRDIAGNNFAGISDADWEFTTGDFTDPIISSLTPAHNATEIAVNATLQLLFSEAMVKGTGSILLTQGTASQSIPVSDASVNVSGNQVTLNPPADFAEGIPVNVTIPEGVFTDEAGNAFAGIAAGEWNFTTKAPVDDTAPTVKTYSPVKDASNVAIIENLTLIFSEDIIKGTGNITINQGVSSQVIPVTDVSVSVSGSTLTIDPPSDFPEKSLVSIQIEAGTLTDLTGNAFAGITATDWRFTTEDKTAPVLATIFPANNAVDIAIDDNLVLTFDETVQAGTGSIVINQGAVSQTIPVTDVTVIIAGNVVTINPSDFSNSETITVTVPAGAFIDEAGNAFAGVSASEWRFTTIAPADTQAPTVTAYTPANNATEITIDANLILTFNEPVEKGVGNITITQGAINQTISVTDAAVNVNGNEVTINPPANFPEGAAISVQIAEGTFTDAAGNNFAGITNATTWNFTTIPPADVAPPVVTTYAPADESVNVAANANLVLTFNEEVAKGTGNLTITQGTTTLVIAVSSDEVSIAGNIVTIDPANDFPSGAFIAVQIEAGVFTDVAGNLYEGISNTGTWNFSVADTAPPAIVSLTPADEATNIAFDAGLEIRYNEPVVKGTGSITINQGANSQVINVNDAAVSITGATVSINPPADFPANTLISIQMPAGTFKDLSDNAAAAIANTTDWNFTTAAPVDATAPTISALAPADQSSGVSIGSELIITFSEDVEIGVGNIVITQGASNQTIAVTSGSVTVNGNQVTINPPSDFASQTEVSVQIQAGAFTDVAGNAFAGITNDTDWNFTTEDTTLPTLTAFTPATNTANVAVSTDLVLTFDEAVKAGTGSIVINQGTSSQTILVTDAAVIIAGNVVTINPADFPNSAIISITVPEGAFTDESGNAFAGTTADQWRFTTVAPADTEAPTVTAYTPATNATNVALASNLALIFSEAVEKGSGNITITQGSSSQIIAVSNAAVVVNGTQVTIDPPLDFPSQAEVSIQIALGAFTDAAGNAFAGIAANNTWRFTTEDKIVPTLASLSPANNTADVAITTDLVLTFDENIKSGIGNITINQGTTSQTIPVTDAAVSIAGNIVTINPSDFANETAITVSVPAGAFIDEAGNAFAGITPAQWSFATISPPDNEAPVVTAYSPPDNAGNVPVGENLVLTFNEAIQKGLGAVTIKYGTSTQVIEVSSASITVDGSQVTIDPVSDFPEGASIAILLQPGSFKDAAGNAFAGITDETTWNFTTEDTTVPVVSELSPADGARNIARSANLVLTFSEPIQKGTGNITINEENNSQIIPVTDAAVTITGAVATIDPPAELLGGKAVSVEIPAGVFKDAAGNNFNGINNAWSFTVADEDVPVVTAFSPVDGATEVAVDANLTITFSEAVVKGIGNIIITQGSSTQIIAVTDDAVTVNGNEVIIDPPSDFPSGAQVWINMAPGVFKDASENEYAGIISETAWNFTVQDIEVPLLNSISPANNASAIAIDADLVLEFNEPIKAGDGNITINKGTNTQVIPVKNPAFVSVSGNTVTINPSDFPNSTTISVTIPEAAFTDASGNTFAGIASIDWSFITEAIADDIPPSITTYAPVDEATAVVLSSDLVLTFDEDVVKGTGNIIITQGSATQTIAVSDAAVNVNGNQVTINPPLDFPSQTGVSVEIEAGAFTDAAGNAFAGIINTTTWNFTTEDKTAPTLTSFSPANNAASIGINANLILTFDEPVEKGAGNITITQGATFQTIAVTDPAVSVNGDQVTIDASDFPNEATITVIVPAGTFVDAAGNAFAGITASEWRFTTQAPADTQAPTVTAYSPLDNATGVVLTSKLALTFSEAIEKGTGNITITQGSSSQTIPVSDASVSISGTLVTIDPPLEFPSQTQVSVQIEAGAFTDLSGNAYAGIANSTTWNFTTEDKTAPVVTSFSPADNFIGVEANANLVLTFDETVEKGTGTILLHQGLSTQSIAVGSAAVSVIDNIVSIDPPLDFPFLASVWVEIPAGAFVDLSANAYGGISEAGTWNFTVLGIIDNTAPVLSATTPADGATSVSLSSNLQLVFSEEVEKGSGNITIAQGTTTQTIPVTDASVSVSGSTVTIDPPLNFASQTEVSVQIQAGAFTDVAGNAFAGITNDTDWSFTTEDTTLPTLTAFTPANNAVDVAIDASLTLTFSETVKAGTGSIVINQGTSSQTIPVTDAAVSIADKVVTINPSDFPNSETITVTVPEGAFTDESGNAFTGIASTEWRFTTIAPADTEAPTVTAYTPATNATNVALASNLALIFSEAVEKGSGNITITQGSSSQIIAVSNAAVVVNGTQVTIDPPLDFPSQAEVSIQIASGAFTDAAGNAFAGIAANNTWRFTTEDKTGPVIVTRTPVDNALQVPIDANLEITFDENIQKGTGEITINQGSTTQQVAISSANVSIEETKVTIDLPVDMPAGTDVYVQLPPGAFTDIGGNPSAAVTEITAWNFKTADPIDITPPSVVTLSPADKSTDVAIDTDMVLTFDEAVNAASGSITITHGEIFQSIVVTDAAVTIDGNEVTINPIDFPNNATVTVTVPAGAFQDASGNAFAGIAPTAWSFTTAAPADTEAPTITAYVPADEATNVALDANLVLIFNEVIEKGAGNITITQGTSTQTIAVTDAAVSVNENEVTIDPPVDFPEGATISVQIAEGVFTDAAGNIFAGITNATTWNFTTAAPVDNIAPVLSSFTPANDATDIDITANLVLTFDENVQAGTGNIVITQGTSSQTIPVSDAAVTIADKVVTINPSDFPNGETITVTVPEGAFTDEAGNAFSGIATANWTFTSAAATDTEAPMVTAYSPANGSTNVPSYQNLTLTFNEEIVAGTGKITITQGNASQEILLPNGQITIAGNTVTINPTADLLEGEDIAIQIEAGTFTDIAGNPFVGILNSTTWAFTTEAAQDETSPIVNEYAPADDAVNVALNTNLVLTFNEPVEKGSGNITITQGTDGQTISVTDAVVSINGNTVTINPETDFAAQTPVYIQIEAGAFKDLAGNNYAGIAGNTSWNFTTAAISDNTAPTLVSFVPASNAVNVAIDANLVLTLSETVVAGVGDIVITQGATSQTIPVTDAAVSINGSEVTINPPANFPNNETITIAIPAGAFTDAAGNTFAGIASTDWTFTTESLTDTEAPIVTTYAPADEATNVSVASNLVLTFNEVIEKGTGNIVITQGTTTQTIAVTDATVSVNGNEVTIDPTADFPEGTAISVQIAEGAFTDIAGNNFAGITNATTWNFSTAALIDNIAPVLSSFTPANDATDIDITANLVLTFDENVQAGTGNIVITQGTSSQTIPVSDAAVTIADKVVTINPSDFPNGETITVTVPEGAFTDAAGNNFAGIDATDWSFTTGTQVDTEAPAITTLNPADEAINIPLAANLVIIFSEPIEKGLGNIIITQGTTSQTIAVTDEAVSVNGNEVTINPPLDLPAETAVSVQIDAGAFQDLAGNNFEGITNSTTWNFNTIAPEDNTAPVLSSFTPAHNATNIATSENITLTFNEPVVAGTGNITIDQGSTSQTIPVTDAALIIDGTEVTIDAADFSNGTIVTVTIPAGAFTDAAGNAFAGIAATDWSFTTAHAQDATPPVLTELLPVEGAVNVAVNENIRLTFDENVKPGSGNITIDQGTTTQTIAVTNTALVTITGNIVTINLADFPNSATVTVTIPAGAFQDAAGNSSAAITRTFSVTAPADATVPIISRLSPPDDATDVTVNADLVITFNEEIKKGIGAITITQGATTQTINVTDETVIIQGATVTINPPEDFPAGSAVSIQMPEGVFTDIAGNDFAGIPDATTWNFTVASPADNIPPQVVSFAPADNAQNVAAGSNLIITFNEPVKKGRGNLIINLGNSTQTLNVASEAVTVQGNTVTINPPEEFPSGTNVNILMLSGVFTDLANNSYAGIDDAETWNFSVPDNIPPVRTLLYPPDNSTDVPPNINLIMVFSENIKKGTGNITITREGTTQTQVVDVNSDVVTVAGTTVIINPTVNFPAASTVNIQMPAGVFTDINGNPYAGISDPTEWNLTISGTIDVTPPSITDLQPADDAVNVAPTSNLVITFSENVQKGTGNITLTQGTTTQLIPVTSEAVSIEGTTVTIDPPNDLPEGAAVNVQIPSGVFSDVSNNNFTGITDATTWNFTINTATTSDNIAPLVNTLSPADDAINVALDANLVITFNEAVKKGSGLIVIQQNNSNRIINVNSNEVSVNGNIVTINPTPNFPANRPIYILITEGTFTDIAGNDFAGISDETGWNFTTGAPVDNTAPTVTAYSPADNARNVPVNANLVITFNETVKKGTGLITITQGNNIQTINISSNAVSITGNRVTINPVADFPLSTAVSVQMPAGAFTDNAGNNFAGIANATTWNFTTAVPADITPPTAITLSPADGAVNVAVNANLVITFSEAIKKGLGVITIQQNNTSREINVTSNEVSITGTTVTINLAADFPAGADIRIQISAGAFQDNAGNNFAGITNETTWNFTTATPVDNTPPTVTTFNPADGAANVAVNANLSITFSEPVVKGTGNITLTQGTSTQTIAVTNAAVSINGVNVTINPPADFPEGTAISIQIAAGAFTDAAGNIFAGITNATTWNFTTVAPIDNTPPQVLTLSPADNAINVAADANLVIAFNEAVKAGTGTIVINQGNASQNIAVPGASITINGSTVTINPPADFPAGASIDVVIPEDAITDLAGNVYEGLDATQWSFTVAPGADNTPPQISTLSPANNGANIAIDVNLGITFNEAIEKGTGNILIRQGNTTLQTIAVTNAAVTLSGNTLTINPPANLPSGTLLNIQLEAGVVKDLAGNAFAGTTNATTWRFTTVAPTDNTPPILSTLSPANGSVNVAATTNLSLTFNENIKKKTGTITLTVNGVARLIPVTDASVTISGNTVTVNPPTDFPDGAQVSVQVPAGVFSDEADNNFTGIAASAWEFTIATPVDNTPPVATTFSPADNSIDVGIDSDLVITFNEPVDKGNGSIEIRQDGTLQTIPVSDPAVTISGNTVTINPASDFKYGASVNVQMLPGVFVDKAGNSFAGIRDASTWGFQTAVLPDQVSPVITALSPADNSQNVASAANLVITFSEQVQKGTGSISISQNGTVQQIPVSDAAVTVLENIVTINPVADFIYEANVFVEIEAGTFKDNSNNVFAGISGNETWNFTIAPAPDTRAPTILNVTPEDEATGIAPDTELTITFSEQIQKGSGTIILTQGSSSQTIDINSSAVSISGEVLTVIPETDFPSGASVSVLILPGSITDLAGNPFAGIIDATTWNFIIQDIIAPQLMAIFPENNASGIAVNTNLVMSFDEEIKKGAGVITISDGTTTQTIDVNSDAVIISGTTVIINPPANFGFDATVSVQMDAGVLTDLAGNPFAGITDPAAWTITAAGFVDDVQPVVVSLSPEDNATQVPANTILEMVFSENVQKGAGSITITQGSISKTIDVSSGSVTVNGAKVTITPGIDFDLGAQLYVQVPKGAFSDLSNNPFAGIVTAAGWNFTIDSTVPVSIVSTSFPEVILSSEATTQASVELNRVPQGLKVEFVSRGIAREQWQKQPVSSNSLIFTASMPQASFDEIGLEYYFDITLASGFKIASDTGYTYIQYVGNGLDLAELNFGAQVSDYQIISIPLELKNKQVYDVLEDNLGEYNIKKWRLFNYENDLLQEYKEGFTTLEAGEAYWLIVKNEANVNTGEGTTLKVRKNNPYTLSLKKGWNQIGNPYNFNVSWNDVRTYNNNPEGLGNLRPFEEEFLDSDILKRQRGAFVFVENDMTLQIPVLKNNTANGRISAEQEMKFTPNALWEINFALRSKEMPYRLAGLGMHPEASPSKDRYDDITVPRFVKYLEMNFKHPEYFAPDFTRDIRPVEENQLWEFTVESNLEPQAVNMQWHSFFSQGYEPGKKLMLLDVNHNKIVDLSRQTQYSFWQDSLTTFKMYYGTPEYIQEHLQSFQTTLSENYPNPFKDNTTINFILSKADASYQVKLEVYNISGQKVATLAEGAYASGAYQVNWDGTDGLGRKLPPGMYIYKLETNSESGPATFTGKMVLQ